MTSTQTDGPAPWPRDRTPGGGLSAILSSPGVKFFMIGVISVALLVPLLLVWGLVEERADRAREVGGRIARGWGGEQTVNGPYLAVPFSVPFRREVNGVATVEETTQWAFVMPERLEASADLKAEERRLSIYTLPVYNGAVTLKGRFGAGMIGDLARQAGTPRLDEAVMVVAISDMAGIRSEVGVAIDGGAPRSFDPGTGPAQSQPLPALAGDKVVDARSGIHRPIERSLMESGFSFEIAFSLNGSRSLSVAPAGQTTAFAAKSDWPHPGFEGQFLPEEKNVTDAGFSATWTIPYLARGIGKVATGPDLPLANAAMAISLVEPVQFYQVISRTLKYAIGFIALVFLAVFVVELQGGRAVHWIQYVLTGLALVVFYVLLLALAEHTGFAVAYLVAAIATTVLISAYLGSATASRRSGLAIGGTLAATYGVMYLVLHEDEYALLAGALISFAAIAVTMYATRRIAAPASRRGPDPAA